MDMFTVLSDLDNSDQANTVCGALEMQGLGVMIEHRWNTYRGAFRVLVPSHQKQRAMQIVASLGWASAANEEELYSVSSAA